jgi:RNA polymerase sigma-70 factor (ECF subfamily)
LQKSLSYDSIQAEYKIIAQVVKQPEKFAYFYEKYYEQIFRYVLRRASCEELAADLTQQTFLKAMLNIEKYVPRGLPFSAWLYRIAANEVNLHYRKDKIEAVFEWEDDEKYALADDSDAIEHDIQLSRLLAALEKLKEDELHLIQLRFYESKSFKEIAYILDLTEANAKMKLYRLLDKIKQKHF